MKKKVFIAMSGGVDSSVSAALLQKQGYDCTGIFMKNWSGSDWGISVDCPWREDQKVVEKVCNILEIPFQTFNFEKEYRKKVVKYFFDEYKEGRTPNPDTLCNREIKFGLFLNRALEKGADYIATGHYVRKIVKPKSMNWKYELHKGFDTSKDQSYFLYMLDQKQLEKSLFPIGKYRKKKVRKLAEKFKLPNYDKPDSQGICFIGNINVDKFIRENLGTKKGDIVNTTGEKLGEHDGIWFYTIGQRKGLGIGGGTPYYVVDIKKNINQVVVGKGANHPRLYKNKIYISNLHWIGDQDKELPLNCEVSIRYNHDPKKAILTKENDRYLLKFEEKQRAPASGQSAVIYKNSLCCGGGTID